ARRSPALGRGRPPPHRTFCYDSPRFPAWGALHVDIAVIGTGYVGLVTGAGLADFGNDVVCVDVDVNKIDALKKGQIPIYEPGLDKIVSRNVGEGRLNFATDLAEAIRGSRAIFLAV